MFEKIEKEIDNECSKCDKQCEKYGCLAYRIQKIISSDIEVSSLNIDAFFELETQPTLFDFWSDEL